jgi:hypothetical protein
MCIDVRYEVGWIIATRNRLSENVREKEREKEASSVVETFFVSMSLASGVMVRHCFDRKALAISINSLTE